MLKNKFKALDKEDKSVIEADGCSNEFIFDGDGFARVDIPWIDGMSRTSIDSSRLELKQYIGRCDKNEKEIYSDLHIVRIHDNSCEYFPSEEDGGELFIIKWWDEMCGFWLWNIDGNDWWYGDINPFSYLSSDEIEIIGTVQENLQAICSQAA